MKPQPCLTFFCELPAEQLKECFSAATIHALKELHANLSLGIKDFSNERAAIVQQLTKAGIPVTAWILLPEEKGYWTSLDTVAETATVYAQFKAWTVKHKLQWAAIGLDIEPRYNKISLFGPNWIKATPNIFLRMFQTGKYRRLEGDLRALINLIRNDGYAVETYNFPFVVDERIADSNVFAKAMGITALNSDREVLMLYSSGFDKNGDAILWSYAHQAQGIGLGSTGGGVILDDDQPMKAMRWLDLRRDLLIASSFTERIYIFSLEGCIANQYLEKLVNFDWNGSVQMPVENGRKISLLRKGMQGLLWILSHLAAVLLILLGIRSLKKKK
jgi:hypothetical protein